MSDKRQDQSLKRAQDHLRRIVAREEGREDAAGTYSLIATQLLARSLRLQAGSGPGNRAARRFLHGVLVQLRDDLQSAGLELDDVLLGRTG